MKAGEDAESFRKQEPLVDQIGLGNQAEVAVKKLRRLRREEQLRADSGWQERVKGIDQQIEAADAVVITEVDFAEMGLRERSRLFVALSRARLQVALVTSERAAGVMVERLG